MFKKKYLGFFLMGLGGIVGALVILMNFISRGQVGLLLFLLAAAVGCVALGSVFAFSQILDHIIQPVIVEIDEDVQDDIEDIKTKGMTNALFMFLSTGLAALIFFYFVLKLHKIEATWGGLPVIIPAGIVVVIGTLIVLNTSWFHDQQMPTPLWVFFIPVIGIGLTLILGLQTENRRNLSWNAPDQVVYNDFNPVASDILNSDFLFSGSDSSSSCDDDACLAIVLIVALVVITLVMVIGSAFIPHFWLLSGMVFLAILTIITIHEIRIRRTAKEAADLAESNQRVSAMRKLPDEPPEEESGINKENKDG
jgi:uncharacterized protein (DUF983 family)